MCREPAHDPAHFLGRRSLRLRFDTHEAGNVHLLCREHHNKSHTNDAEYEKALRKKGGPAAIRVLQERRRETKTMLNAELKEIESRLLNELVEERRK